MTLAGPHLEAHTHAKDLRKSSRGEGVFPETTSSAEVRDGKLTVHLSRWHARDGATTYVSLGQVPRGFAFGVDLRAFR